MYRVVHAAINPRRNQWGGTGPPAARFLNIFGLKIEMLKYCAPIRTQDEVEDPSGFLRVCAASGIAGSYLESHRCARFALTTRKLSPCPWWLGGLLSQNPAPRAATRQAFAAGYARDFVVPGLGMGLLLDTIHSLATNRSMALPSSLARPGV